MHRPAAAWHTGLFAALALAFLAGSPACTNPAVPAGKASGQAARGMQERGPEVFVLGSAQDGGLPQLACTGELCAAAREKPERMRHPSSLLVLDPATDQRWLLDASPKLAEQVELARSLGIAPRASTAAERAPLWDGIFLTHAHYGHFSGLALLGREVFGAQGQLVLASPRLLAHLESTAPYSLYVQAGHLRLQALALNQVLRLSQDLAVESFAVPHRDEWSDTLAFVLIGPSRRLLYLPDIDKWERFEIALEDLLARVDYALLDGTFFADGEIPGRSMAEIPHPFIVETMAKLAHLPASERSKVHFIHLNHTNPASDPSSEAAARIRAAGMHVAREGQRFLL